MENFTPMVFSQLDVNMGKHIVFVLPPSAAYGHNVEVFVDFGDSIKDPEKVVCNAWLRAPSEMPAIRFFANTETIKKPGEGETYEDIIVQALNNSTEFDEQLHQFVEKMLNRQK